MKTSNVKWLWLLNAATIVLNVPLALIIMLSKIVNDLQNSILLIRKPMNGCLIV